MPRQVRCPRDKDRGRNRDEQEKIHQAKWPRDMGRNRDRVGKTRYTKTRFIMEIPKKFEKVKLSEEINKVGYEVGVL